MSKIVAALGSVLVALVLATWAVAGPAKAHTQNIRIMIMAGDQLYAGENFAIAPGVPVRVTVTNFSHEFHTFTAPGLHLSELIRPADASGVSTTSFTFTAHTWGAFAWHCLICPSGMHGRSHHMGGTIYIIEKRSVLP
jgi:hypothetical protein